MQAHLYTDNIIALLEKNHIPLLNVDLFSIDIDLNTFWWVLITSYHVSKMTQNDLKHWTAEIFTNKSKWIIQSQLFKAGRDWYSFAVSLTNITNLVSIISMIVLLPSAQNCLSCDLISNPAMDIVWVVDQQKRQWWPNYASYSYIGGDKLNNQILNLEATQALK